MNNNIDNDKEDIKTKEENEKEQEEKGLSRKSISDNIKGVLGVFLICFLCIIAYITYFEIFKSNSWKESPQNLRTIAKNNEILRGNILDCNGNVLAKSSKTDKFNQKREYPYGAYFTHVIGYLTNSGGRGLEVLYNENLTSVGVFDNIKSFFGNLKEEKKVGRTVVTTLDTNLQKLGYDLLNGHKGSIVALNPKTGEVLAEVSAPSFDPNTLSKNWEQISKDSNAPLTNRAVSGLYPPGSIFKTITATSALQNIEGVNKRIFKDNGVLTFNKTESLRNYNGNAFGNIDLRTAFAKSSNVVFGTLGMELGSDLKDTAEKFLFNKNVPSDGLLMENSVFPALKKEQIGEKAQSAIGQSAVLVTPMQMALVASAIANDGDMMKPSLVKEVRDASGDVVKKFSEEVISTVTSKAIANEVKEYMKAVMTEGTASAFNIPSLHIAGKTGTADHKEGANTNAHSWFIGFAPAEDPKVAVAVLVEEGEQMGGISTNIAVEMIKKALQR